MIYCSAIPPPVRTAASSIEVKKDLPVGDYIIRADVIRPRNG